MWKNFYTTQHCLKNYPISSINIRYILNVLTYSTPLDQYATFLFKNPSCLGVSQNAYLSLLTHIKQLLLVTFFFIKLQDMERLESVMEKLTNLLLEGHTDINFEVAI